MEIERLYEWDDNGQPLMILRKRGQIKSAHILTLREPEPSFGIKLTDAWLYSEDHNPERFKDVMFITCSFLCQLFNLGEPTPKRMAELATIIQDGLHDLINLRPEPKEHELIGVAEVEFEGGKQELLINHRRKAWTRGDYR